MAANYKYAAGVEEEIWQAGTWYARENLALGMDFLDAVSQTIDDICNTPKRFPAVWRDVRRALTRRFPYKVLFYEDGDTVIVLAVLHDARRPSAWQRRR